MVSSWLSRTTSRLLLLALLSATATAFVSPPPLVSTKSVLHVLRAYSDEVGPSDYDSDDLAKQKQVEVDEDEDDAEIRDALKRELLLLSSVTNRGECASKDEINILIDLVTQLEALNPTANPASMCEGEWSLCLSSTQLFRSSPFFQSLRVAMGDAQMANNGFELHDRATTGSRIGRVRQTITSDTLVSEVELEVGFVPGLPFRIKGTVITTASLQVAASETWDLTIQTSKVTGSNVPLLNQFLDDAQLTLPVGDIYKTIQQGSIPVVQMKTYYVDEGIRITRDVDDNFFVFSRA
ncbi:PAP_fibrillin [Seminavis robusta]|uniref:PAP_fibrillin n=1 Tax=Seminavis robusta TaxID=568900 RepID=A0A9N8DKP5_9STRA|nr:PAP_fibrillin [Seminavis robusta]|eukprot:Sro181_g079130.1 PAP_fibrillin (295) ;mRNA; r:64320-65204